MYVNIITYFTKIDTTVGIDQGSSNLTLEVKSAAELRTNPDQTHLWFSNDLEDFD